MKAIIVVGKEKVGIKEVPLPDRMVDEALIDVKAAGICGSDRWPYLEGKETYIGHEIAGIVEIPGNSGILKKGDRVVLNVIWGCGECEYCQNGQENYCQDRWTKGRYFKPRGIAEKIVYVERMCLKIPDFMSFETAIAVGGCGLGVSWHGIKMLNIQKGELVPVFGVGPIGLCAVMILNYLKAKPIAIDVSDYRLDLAIKFGAIEKLKFDDPANIELFFKKLRNKIHNSIVCTGNHDAASFGLSCLAPLGKMLVLGGLSQWKLDSWRMIGIDDKSIIGSWHYHRREWQEIIKLVEDGVPVSELVTHIFSFEQANEAFTVFFSGNSGKVIITL